jgi:hypothetical protein
MEEGFVIDRTQGLTKQSEWVEGPPQTSFFLSGSVKLWGKVRLPVTTFRCPGCGYLESYARQKESAG